MPTNANTFNSRVTSESLEAKFRQVFPAQGGAELVQDLFASGVIQPVVDFSSVAEGSVLPEYLQTAWDLATTSAFARNTSATVTNSPGFWQIDLNCMFYTTSGSGKYGRITLSDGFTTRNIWKIESPTGTSGQVAAVENKFIVFVKTGETVTAQTNDTAIAMDVWTRQVADVNGTLVNPLGFTFT